MRSGPTIHTERRALAHDLDNVTDAQWAMPLVLAMTGRTAALDDLSGDGVAALRARP